MEGSGAGGTIKLPAGVKIGAGRETTQTNSAGQVVQGTLFPLTLKGGTTSSVFVPHSDLGDLSEIQSLIDRRVNALAAITGG